MGLTSVGRPGVKGGGFGLGHFLHLSVEFTGGCLVEFDFLLKPRGADGVEHAEDTHTVAVGCVFGHIKRDLDVTHGTKVVDLGGLDIGNDGNEIGGVAKITVVQEDLDASLVTVLVNVINASGVERRRTSHNTVNLSIKNQSKGKPTG